MLRLSEKSLLGRTAKLKYLHSLPRTISVVFFSNSTEDAKQTDTAQGRKEYDIAIVGGGMVGAAVGCGLASLPLTKALKIAIIDSNLTLGVKRIFPKDDIPDPRVSAITPATVSFFKGAMHDNPLTFDDHYTDIGAWEYVQECRCAPFDKMQVWDYTGWGYTRYNARDVGKQVLGYVVENKVLHSALLLCLQDKGYAEMIYPAKVKSVHSPSNSQSVSKENSTGQAHNNNTLSASSEGPSGSSFPHSLAKVELDDGSCLYARLVVGADGGRSQVRSMVGFQTSGWDYKQHALICTVELETENQTAWQRFLPTGPLALLPMGKKLSNIVWSTTPEQAAQLKGMNQNEFIQAVNNALEHDCRPHLLSKISSVLNSTPLTSESFEVPPRVTALSTERMSFPLSLMHSHSYASNRVVLVGDAAHTVHPLAGQGVNLGFGDAAELVRVLNEGISTGFDIGEISLLKKYERERKLVNLPMMAILDGFQRIFSADFGPVNMLRAAAFGGVQFLGPLKRQVISYAMGEQKWPLFSLNLDKVLHS